ncbi:hypothetical protein T459_06929 [Capsicum annuum]|uniref:ATPase AAA-type core domain-containing protein n=1 Tax=Capsicum annuum TaxID=4072 RepID=A0A2G3AC42_CAPAN|nr:hypothetical protein T459_06929 [Capsicum annuum]
MDPKKKEEIINDLVAFTKGKDYYFKVGKPWKCGYLLYGPPGTGKSTMIAAIANFLNYDSYDLELTSVIDNLELRKLLMEQQASPLLSLKTLIAPLISLARERRKKREKRRRKRRRRMNQSIQIQTLILIRTRTRTQRE